MFHPVLRNIRHAHPIPSIRAIARVDLPQKGVSRPKVYHLSTDLLGGLAQIWSKASSIAHLARIALAFYQPSAPGRSCQAKVVVPVRQLQQSRAAGSLAPVQNHLQLRALLAPDGDVASRGEHGSVSRPAAPFEMSRCSPHRPTAPSAPRSGVHVSDRPWDPVRILVMHASHQRAAPLPSATRPRKPVGKRARLVSTSFCQSELPKSNSITLPASRWVAQRIGSGLRVRVRKPQLPAEAFRGEPSSRNTPNRESLPMFGTTSPTPLQSSDSMPHRTNTGLQGGGDRVCIESPLHALVQLG